MNRRTARPQMRIASDVARATTLDERLHYDAGLHARVVESVFARSWQILPSTAHRVTPFTLLEGSLDEPLQIVRDDAGEERVLSNVCTHRGALLNAECSDTRTIRCPYHGRRFDAVGKMTSCPGFEGAKEFPRTEDDLAVLPMESVGPLRFTSLDSDVPFEEWSGPLVRTLSEFDGLDLEYEPGGEALYDIECSWALYCENYLEGFHIPYAHPGLAKEVDFGRYRTELFPSAVRQVGLANADQPTLESWSPEDVVADYLWLYPNLMVNAYAWGISVNVVEPTGPGRCRVRYLRWVARPKSLGGGAGGALETVEEEDQRIVEAVQRGVRSRLYPGGRFSPRLETGPHHFQRLLAESLQVSEF